MQIPKHLLREIENLIELEAYEVQQKKASSSSAYSPPNDSPSPLENPITAENSAFQPKEQENADLFDKKRKRTRLHPMQRAIILSEILKRPGSR